MNRISGAVFALCWLAAPAAAQDTAIPYLSGRVVDRTIGTINAMMAGNH